MTTLTAVMMGCAVMAAPTIEIERAEVSVPAPDTVRVTVSAMGQEVQVGSYGLRTLSAEDAAPPGFRERGDHAFFAFAGEDDDLWHLLLDNERGDGEPAEGTVAFDLDVAEWPDGAYRFLLFACNRPAGGDYVHDDEVLRVEVRDGMVVEEGTFFAGDLTVRVEDFEVAPERIAAGEPVTITASAIAENAGAILWQFTVPYWVERDDVPPGLRYDPEENRAYLGEEAYFGDNEPPDEDPEAGAARITLATEGWEAGVYNFTLVAAAQVAPGTVNAYRDLAITVRPEDPRFEVTAEHEQQLRPGTHFSTMCRLDDGCVIAHGFITRDGGRSWERLEGGSIPMATQLRDGTIIGLGMRTQPIEGRPGWYSTTLARSTDRGQTVERTSCELHVPRAIAGIGHAPAAGPLLWRSIVEMPDGALLVAAYGWFEGDDSPVPGQPGSCYYRTFVSRSEDRGETWEYLATVAYDPAIGTEGYCEPVIRLLPDGDLLALLRTGGDSRPYHLDNPLCVTRSSDGGRTWEEPQRTGFEGVSPDLCVMSDGTLACSTGRPGAWLLLSDDGGRTWTDAVSIDATRYSGYTAVCEVEPGVLLYGYGAKDWLDPQTGERHNSLRTVRLHVRRLR